MENKNKKYRFVRRLAKVFGVLVLFIFLVLLFIRSPWGQNIIVNKVTDYISDKTNTKVEIDRLFITFTGNAFLEGVYLEDKKGDTLLYSKTLEANIPLSSLLFRNELNLKFLKSEGLRANIIRDADTEKFNYEFLLDAFVATDTVAQQPAAEPLQISLGEFDLSDLDMTYNDFFLGMEFSLKMDKLLVSVNEADLETMNFDVDELNLSNTSIVYKQTKPLVSEENSGTQLPILSIDNLGINNVRINYNSIPDGIIADVLLGEFNLELPNADLARNEFDVALVSLKNSDIFLELKNGNLTSQDSTGSTLQKEGFIWPEIFIKADKINLANNSLQYQFNNIPSLNGQFNPNHIFLRDLALSASDVNYEPKKANIVLDQFSFRDKSGFYLQHMAMKATLDDTSASLSGLEVRTAQSAISGSVRLEFPSIDEFVNAPENTKANLELDTLKIGLQDALIFQPSLATKKYYTTAQQHPFYGNLTMTGTLEDLFIPKFDLKWNNSSLKGKGHLYRVMDTDVLSFEVITLIATTSKADLQLFIPEQNLNVSLPETILVEAQAKGNLKSVSGDVFLKIPEGTAKITGNFSNTKNLIFDGELKVDTLQVGKLLKNDQLGTMSLTLKASGNGSTLKTLNAEFESDFTQLKLNSYDFSNLEFNGQISNGKGNINLDFKDNNLNFTSKTAVALDTKNSKFDVKLALIGADLQALGVTIENIKAGLEMDAHFNGNLDNYALDATIKNGVAVYDGQQYQMGDINVTSKIDTIKTEVSIKSPFLNGNLSSNATPQNINTSLTQYFKNYLQDSPRAVSPKDSLKLQLYLKLTPNPILTKVFFRDIEQLDSISVSAKFNAGTKTLVSNLQMPYIKYAGITLDSLNFGITGDSTNLSFKAGLANLIADPVKIGRTYFEGTLEKKKLLLEFNSYNGKEKVAHISSEMTLENDTTQIHINPSELIFNKKEWTIPEDNRISIGPKLLEFKNLKLARNSQALSITSTNSGKEEKHLDLNFDQFELQTFLSILNSEQPLLSGVLNGDLTIENPLGATGIVADFKLNELHILEHALGNLTLNANSISNGNYDFDLSLKGGGADLDLEGDYAAAETGAKLNLDLDLNRIDLAFIEKFSNGALKDSHGSISGNIDVSGTTVSQEYSGFVKFNEADFNVATLNSVFTITDQTLKVDNQGLYLNNFQIADANGSTFDMDGSIGTEELMNPNFDLKLNAKQFQALNSTAEDNELFYGKASFDLDVNVQGNLNLPKIEGKVRVRKVTDITYVVPEAQLDVQEREGIVLFVNRENPDAILTRNDYEETPAFFSGMDAKLILELADDSVFHIIIDERSGDNLEMSGNASLNLNVEPNGRMSLTGRYELSTGHYETSLYNLVKRRFEINPGSTITWEGDPMDAKLDVTAVYKVETSAAPLMSAVTSGEDISVTNKYRQVLPFIVYLNVDGELLQPKLSFGLDMPENEQGSLGGAVYGRVQQLNQQEAELNKQVFSLLALNRFYPSSGSDGSSGGTAAIARNNVNKVLSGQLNAFSDKIFGSSGFEVDFDLDSFTDYQGDSPQDRTQLDINAKKKLFDDRLVVTAGSAVDVEGSAQPGQEETPIIGNVSLEYLITKDGTYRLRGFRKNEYANIIDGQLIVTGIALIFNREFNKFSQLFSPLKEEESPDVKEKKEN